MNVHLIVGLPGSGKTTRAKELEASESALRLTPDDWHTAVFPADDPNRWRTPERVDQRDRIEGRLVGLGMRAIQLGLNVVFDFGLWSKDERSALRWMAASLGARSQIVYLPVDPEEQSQRVSDRTRSEPGQFAFTDNDLRQWRAQFEVPDRDELDGTTIPPAPLEHPTWLSWAQQRWPSLPRG